MGMHGHAWACMGMHGACVRPIYASSRSSYTTRARAIWIRDVCARATSIDGRIDGRRSHRRWAHRWASMGRRWGVRARHTATTTTTTTTGDDDDRRTGIRGRGDTDATHTGAATHARHARHARRRRRRRRRLGSDAPWVRFRFRFRFD